MKTWLGLIPLLVLSLGCEAHDSVCGTEPTLAECHDLGVCIPPADSATEPPVNTCVMLDDELSCAQACVDDEGCDTQWYDGCTTRADDDTRICTPRADVDAAQFKVEACE